MSNMKKSTPNAVKFCKQLSTSSSSSTKQSPEEDFLHAAEFGDIHTVKRLLIEQPELNADCVDALGRNALRLAIKNEHLGIVEVLLDRSSGRHIYEAVLQAISEEHIKIAEIILKHRRYKDMTKERKKLGDEDRFFKTSFDESQFSPDITPLVLASHKNQYEIVQLLLSRGEVIQMPHKFNCHCQECVNKAKFDKLRCAKYRMNAYRGLASEAYISLSSQDPILTAFKLGSELKYLAEKEKHFKREYKEMANQLSEYVVKLLDRVRTQEELEIVLNKTGKPSANTYSSLARFKLAIDFGEKKFVAHPSCQQRLINTWNQGLTNMKRKNWPRRISMCFLFLFVYPVIAMIHIFVPSKTLIQRINIPKININVIYFPTVKFLSEVVSFFAFLCLVIVSTVESSYTLSKDKSLKEMFDDVHRKYETIKNQSNQSLYGTDFPLRQLKPTTTQFLITIWIIGMVLQECNQLYSSGYRSYFKSLYNLMDSALLWMYLCSYSLLYVCMFKLWESIDFIDNIVVNTTVKLDGEYVSEFMERVYWLNADRYWWDQYDPTNTAEAMFAIANIFSFLRISYLLPANEMLGPLQISLERMLTDIGKFLVLFFLVFGAFMIGVRNLFWYYTVRESIEITPHHDVTPESAKALAHFSDMFVKIRTMFWSLYGRGNVDLVELGPYENQMTQNFAIWIYGVYNIVMLTILLNMLIAMMAKSYENINQDADVEWKFARSKLYMDYIGNEAVLPVPLNILGLARTIIKLTCCRDEETKETDKDEDPGSYEAPSARESLSKTSQSDTMFLAVKGDTLLPEDMGKRLSFDVNSVKQMELLNTSDTQNTYKKVIDTIIQRYIFHIQREADVIEDDCEEIKQDLSNFRNEVINSLIGQTEALTELRKGMERLAEDTKIICEKLRVTSSNPYPLLRNNQSGNRISKSGLNPSLSSVSEVSRESLSSEKIPLAKKASLDSL